MFAVVLFTRYFRHYFVGAKFTLRADHKALLWLKSFKDSDGVLARWIEKLEAFDFTIVHRPGHLHSNADALSRLPECSFDCFVECDVDSPTENLNTSMGQATVISNNTSTELEHLVKHVAEQTAKIVSDDSQNWLDYFSPDAVRKAQSEDADIDMMIDWQQAFIDRPIRSDKPMKGASLCLMRLWSQWKRLEVHDGILYHRYESSDCSKTRLQLVIANNLKVEALTMLHDNCSGGQLGTERTIEKARARFYWPFMFSDVELHCKSCDLCSARRKPARRPEHQCKLIADYRTFRARGTGTQCE